MSYMMVNKVIYCAPEVIPSFRGNVVASLCQAVSEQSWSRPADLGSRSPDLGSRPRVQIPRPRGPDLGVQTSDLSFWDTSSTTQRYVVSFISAAGVDVQGLVQRATLTGHQARLSVGGISHIPQRSLLGS